jgi:hypothetical protein
VDSTTGRANDALGGVPMFFSREGDVTIARGRPSGSIRPQAPSKTDTFRLSLQSGGSGPAGVQRVSGTGTRHIASASEPTTMLLIGGALLAAAWPRPKIA